MHIHNILRCYLIHVPVVIDVMHIIASFYFSMLDDVELSHNGEQYILVQNERNSIHFTSSEQ